MDTLSSYNIYNISTYLTLKDRLIHVSSVSKYMLSCISNNDYMWNILCKSLTLKNKLEFIQKYNNICRNCSSAYTISESTSFSDTLPYCISCTNKKFMNYQKYLRHEYTKIKDNITKHSVMIRYYLNENDMSNIISIESRDTFQRYDMILQLYSYIDIHDFIFKKFGDIYGYTLIINRKVKENLKKKAEEKKFIKTVEKYTKNKIDYINTYLQNKNIHLPDIIFNYIFHDYIVINTNITENIIYSEELCNLLKDAENVYNKELLIINKFKKNNIEYDNDIQNLFIQNYTFPYNKLYEMCKRKYLLKIKLQKYNLIIRDDSELCRNYIRVGGNNLNYIIEKMRELDWYFTNTNYLNIRTNMKKTQNLDKYALSKNAKIESLKQINVSIDSLPYFIKKN
jgi:hypothetical protein